MLRATVKLMVLGLLAGGMLVAESSDAQAWWGSRGGSYGSYGSHGSYGSYGCSGGSYGSYGCSGSYGSYGSRGYSWKAARRAYRASYYSCGSTGVVYSGSYGSYGSTGSYGSYGSTGSYGSYGSTGSTGDVYYYEEEVEAVEADGASARSTSATLTVAVPADAKVFVNGSETTTPGNERTFVSSGLRPGYSYSYEVRVEATGVDGAVVSETQTVELQAGHAERIAFNFEEGSQVAEVETVDTSLTLHVPADAQVYLLGQETAADGELRTFHTGRLAQGQNWENYTIRVVVERDGEQFEQERTITLAGGEEREESFDFSAPRVASNR